MPSSFGTWAMFYIVLRYFPFLNSPCARSWARWARSCCLPRRALFRRSYRSMVSASFMAIWSMPCARHFADLRNAPIVRPLRDLILISRAPQPALLPQARHPPDDQHRCGNRGDRVAQMMMEDFADQQPDLRPVADHDQRLDREADEPAKEDGREKTREAHLGDAGGEHEQFERRGRRQHRR